MTVTWTEKAILEIFHPDINNETRAVLLPELFKWNSDLLPRRKYKNLVLFWKIFNSYLYVLMDYDTINNIEDILLVESVIWQFSDKTVKRQP